MKNFVVFFGVCVSMLAGCATMSVDKQRASKVKRAAIIAFSADDEMDRGGDDAPKLLQTVNQAKAVAKVADGSLDAAVKQRGKDTYHLMTKALREDLGWEVLPLESVAGNSDYAAFVSQVAKQRSALQQAAVAYAGGAEGIMYWMDAQSLEAEQFQDLAKKLGVDVVLVSHVRFVVGDKSGFAIGGIGDVTLRPKAVVSVSAYDRNSPEPLWRDRAAIGEPTEGGIKNTLGVSFDGELEKLFVQAAQSGYSALVARYQEAAQ